MHSVIVHGVLATQRQESALRVQSVRQPVPGCRVLDLVFRHEELAEHPAHAVLLDHGHRRGQVYSHGQVDPAQRVAVPEALQGALLGEAQRHIPRIKPRLAAVLLDASKLRQELGAVRQTLLRLGDLLEDIACAD